MAVAEKATPPVPKYLSRKEKSVWRDIIGELEKIGVMALVDERALARYCQLWIRWLEICEFLSKNGWTYQTRMAVRESEKVGPEEWDEYEVKCNQRPEAAQLDKIAGHLLRLEQQFGLTPSARSSIQILGGRKEPEGVDPARLRLLKKSQKKA